MILAYQLSGSLLPSLHSSSFALRRSPHLCVFQVRENPCTSSDTSPSAQPSAFHFPLHIVHHCLLWVNTCSSSSLIFSDFAPLECSEPSAPGRLPFLVSYNDTLDPTSFQEELHEVRGCPQQVLCMVPGTKWTRQVLVEALDDQLISQGAKLDQR